MGPVFRGDDSETSQPVAVTVLRLGLSAERAALAASALASLRDRWPAHAALPRAIDSGLVDDEPYLVTSLPDGDPLDAALREFGPAQLVDAVPRLRVVADALDTAAAVGFSHGRLHPRDIVVSVDGTAVTGVGLVPLVERLGVAVAGRRPYAAPEVAAGAGTSPAVDQYALGAIAYEWLTGRPLSGPPRLALPGLAADDQAGLSAAIARAMANDPAERFTTATAFVDAVAACVPEAGARVRSSRRTPRVSAPRLAFDDVESGAAPTVVPDLDLRPTAATAEIDARVTAVDDLFVAPAVATPDLTLADHDVALPTGTPMVVDLEDESALRQGMDAPVVGSDHDDAVTVASSFDDVIGTRPPWIRWVIGAAAALAFAIAGGWLLLRLGTPSRDATRASVETPGAAAAPASAPNVIPPPVTAAPANAASPPATAPAATNAARAGAETAPSPTAAPDVPPAALAVGAAAKTAPRASAPVRPGAVSSPRRETTRPARAAPAPVRAPGPGRLLVRSTPSGAEVFVNGTRRGVTPLAVRDIELGAHAVRVVRAGFTPAQQRVVLDAGRPSRAIELTLARVAAPAATPAPAPTAAATGVLVVESRPAGARVMIDGANVGVTPLTVSSLSVGAHAVHIDQRGYAPVRTTARVEPGARARVAVTLTPERQ